MLSGCFVTVDQRADAALTDLRVHPIREVDRRRTFRQIQHVASRGQHVDPSVFDVGAQLASDGNETADFLVPRENLAQPAQLLRVERIELAGFGLVRPMRAHAEFRLAMHLARADLDFDRALIGTDDGGVDRPITVVLRVGDVVVELARHVTPARVNDTQRRVAIPDRRHDDAQRADVVDLVEVDALRVHLPPDAVDVLRAPANLRLDAFLRERGREHRATLVTSSSRWMRLPSSRDAMRRYSSGFW